MVTKLEVGFSKKSLAKVGMLVKASGNVSSKNEITFFSVFKLSKEFSPFKGKNKVAVKLPSKLGKAISINSLLGQMCKQFLLKQCVPFGRAGTCNSLYP